MAGFRIGEQVIQLNKLDLGVGSVVSAEGGEVVVQFKGKLLNLRAHHLASMEGRPHAYAWRFARKDAGGKPSDG